MGRFDNAGGSSSFQMLHERFSYLLPDPFLDLESLRVYIEQSGELRDSNYLSVLSWDVSHMGLSEKG